MGPIRLPKAPNHNLRDAVPQPLRIHKNKPFLGLFSQPHQEICNPDPNIPVLLKRKQHCPLRFEAREHSIEEDKQIRD